MSATEEKIAHDKWVRDLKDNKVEDAVITAVLLSVLPFLHTGKRPFKRLQLI